MNKELVNKRWLLKGLTSNVDYKRDMYICQPRERQDGDGRQQDQSQTSSITSSPGRHWYDR